MMLRDMVKLARNLLAAFVAAGTGVYVLHWMHNLWGVAGVGLALAIAFPTELKGGVTAIKDDAAEVKGALDSVKGAE